MDDAMKPSEMALTPNKKNQAPEKHLPSGKSWLRPRAERRAAANSESSDDPSEVRDNSTQTADAADGSSPSTADEKPVSATPSGKSSDLSGLFKKVVVSNQPSNLASSKETPPTGVAPSDPPASKDESEPGAEDLSATKPLNIYKAANATAPEPEAEEDAGSSGKTPQGPPPSSISKALTATPPRVAGDNEPTKYFRIPGTTYPPLHQGASLSGERTPAGDSARQSIGFTQLLRSVSSREETVFPQLSPIENSRNGHTESQEESIHRVFYPALKAVEEAQESPSPSFKEHSRADAVQGSAAPRNNASLPRSLTHEPGERLPALLLWLLGLDLAMTALLLVAVVCILFHIFHI